MTGGRFELAMEPEAIGLVSFNSNSEMHVTAICDARLIYRWGWITRVYASCAAVRGLIMGIDICLGDTYIDFHAVQSGKLRYKP